MFAPFAMICPGHAELQHSHWNTACLCFCHTHTRARTLKHREGLVGGWLTGRDYVRAVFVNQDQTPPPNLWPHHRRDNQRLSEWLCWDGNFTEAWTSCVFVRRGRGGCTNAYVYVHEIACVKYEDRQAYNICGNARAKYNSQQFLQLCDCSDFHFK